MSVFPFLTGLKTYGTKSQTKYKNRAAFDYSFVRNFKAGNRNEDVKKLILNKEQSGDNTYVDSNDLLEKALERGNLTHIAKNLEGLDSYFTFRDNESRIRKIRDKYNDISSRMNLAYHKISNLRSEILTAEDLKKKKKQDLNMSELDIYKRYPSNLKELDKQIILINKLIDEMKTLESRRFDIDEDNKYEKELEKLYDMRNPKNIDLDNATNDDYVASREDMNKRKFFTEGVSNLGENNINIEPLDEVDIPLRK